MTLNTRQISPADYAGRQRFPRISPGSEQVSRSTTGSSTSLSPQNSPVVSPAVSPHISVVRVLIAGDHAALRSCLKTMLELDPQISVVGEAADDGEMIKMAQRVRPDVVLVDLDMNCCDCGYDALMEIREARLANSVVALSIHDCEEQRTAAQKAGVNQFLEKGVPYKQLISAIRTAANANSQR